MIMTSTPFRLRSRLVAALAVAALASGLLAACGGDDDSGSGATQTTTASTQPATTDTTATTETATSTQEAAADGKAVFTENCGSCHTLSDAGTSGAVGPNLDDLKPSTAKVAAMVKAGGGAMPPFDGVLSPAEITAVSEYVSSVAGG